MYAIKKQQGATLFTSLIILLAITVLGISAARISSMDILVSSNEQQRMMLYQKAESALSTFVTTKNINDWSKQSQIPVYKEGDYTVKGKIKNLNKDYYCMSENGAAISLGSDAPCCKIYDFEVTVTHKGSTAKETHYRGAGQAQARKCSI